MLTYSVPGSGVSTSHQYRPDGMRVHKGNYILNGNLPQVIEAYRYDGQMPVETSTHDSSAGTTTVNRNGLGARGMDFMSTTTSQGTNVGYPVYDAHGNMVATLAKSGSGYVVSNRRAFDAWGGIRQGSTSGEPKGRYCASIGHVQDDESGLVYMRARYYEPTTGRFLSEDAGRDGQNWFAYAANSPETAVDYSGKNIIDDFGRGMLIGFLAGFYTLLEGKFPNLKDLVYSTTIGAVIDAAQKWITKALMDLVDRPGGKLNFAGKMLTGAFAGAAAVATYYGMRAGEISLELFCIQLEEGQDGYRF